MYQEDNEVIHIARLVTEWFDEHESQVEHLLLDCPAQSPDLNSFVVEEGVRKTFPPQASCSDLATVLQEKWLKIHLAMLAGLLALWLNFQENLQCKDRI